MARLRFKTGTPQGIVRATLEIGNLIAAMLRRLYVLPVLIPNFESMPSVLL